MAGLPNRLEVNFEPCIPAPANGYNLQYRPSGSTGAYRNGGNFASSPAIVSGIPDPEGTQYEGFIRSDCGGGGFGGQVPFLTGGGCVPVSLGSVSMPNAQAGVPYSGYVLLNGTPAFTVQREVVPLWITLTPLPDRVTLTGTPPAAGAGFRVSFWVRNCGAANEVKFNGDITINP